MAKHKHKAVRTDTRPFFYCVSRMCNEASHGNVTLHHTCSCGKVQLVNVNQGHREHGRWHDPD